MDKPTFKLCRKCGADKPAEMFPLNYHNGHRKSPCKSCTVSQTNAWRNRNKKRLNALARVRSKTDHSRELSRERQRQHRQRRLQSARIENARKRREQIARHERWLAFCDKAELDVLAVTLPEDVEVREPLLQLIRKVRKLAKTKRSDEHNVMKAIRSGCWTVRDITDEICLPKETVIPIITDLRRKGKVKAAANGKIYRPATI